MSNPFHEAAPNRRALVIDDDPANREACAALLETVGYEVVQAGDGSTGLTLIISWHPDLVVTDIDMPQLDGIALARAVRKDPALCHTALVALSGLALPIEHLVEFEAVLTKPVDADLLLEAVMRVLVRNAEH
jgi:CheY-like chemotaxis protein